MELIKRNVHMNKLKCKSSVQLTLDDDFNVPDVKPDISKIIKEQGDINISEVKSMNGKLLIKGSLVFHMLYISEDEVATVHNMIGEIPFNETINMDDACTGDNISVKWELEDLSTSLINSRKISVRSIVGFNFTVEDIYDEETAVSVGGDENTQFINKKIDITQIAVNKKDTYRVKDEVAIPSNKPNILEVLYYEATLRGVDVRLLEDKIHIRGEIVLFILYTGENESRPLEYLETEIGFNSEIECSGCNEEMIGNINLSILSKDLEIKPDADGEERMIDAEIIIELDIKIYEDEELEILSDVYSTSKNLIPTFENGFYDNLVIKNNSKSRVVDRIKLPESQGRVLQICHASGNSKIDEMKYVPNGIEVDGVIDVQILYITDDDKRPLGSLKGIVPFNHMVEAKDIKEESVYEIKSNVEQLNVTMVDSEEIEIKVGLNLNTLVFDKIVEPIITDLRVEDLPLNVLQDMPSIVGYMVKPNDSLWEIAKKYYTTIDSIKEINELEHDGLKKGDKLLIIKSVDSAF